ncbi:hypothetical protein [uncultured Ruminococcus sp.]|uniref:hypothetical protein n=1 Tax=uncultured Ruminococcus sp. TaxID=165186 RepID=UPI0025F63CD1|nr:hypothetical protein [uncultured Ruminococcus sp.]
MTPEQQKHQEDYLIAKRRYENAFAEKRCAENEKNNILNRRKHIINTINELTSERNRSNNSFSEIQRSSAQNGDFDASVKDTETKLEAASAGFLAIGESSVGNPQRLTEVFDERNRNSKSSIASAFEQMKNIGSSIQHKIDDLSYQISQLEQEMECGKNRERYLNNVIAEQDRIMNNASIEMAYHKNHMNG